MIKGLELVGWLAEGGRFSAEGGRVVGVGSGGGAIGAAR